jgi:hypothetical protein
LAVAVVRKPSKTPAAIRVQNFMKIPIGSRDVKFAAMMAAELLFPVWRAAG